MCDVFHNNTLGCTEVVVLEYLIDRHMTNGAVIARSSQPIVGWLGWRSPEDEALLHAIGTSCAVDSASASLKKQMLREVSQKTNRNFHSDAIPNGGVVHGSEMCVDNDNITSSENGEVEPRKVLIVDARAYSAAVVNRAKGGGCECEGKCPFKMNLVWVQKYLSLLIEGVRGIKS